VQNAQGVVGVSAYAGRQCSVRTALWMAGGGREGEVMNAVSPLNPENRIAFWDGPHQGQRRPGRPDNYWFELATWSNPVWSIHSASQGQGAPSCLVVIM
jgi:hypothetical protein